MPVVPFVAVLVATVVANLLLMVIVGALFVRDSRRRLGPPGDAQPAGTMVADHLVKSSADNADWTLVDGVPTADYERVVRIASFLFILTAATVVVATGLWPDHELAILVVLAIAGLSVLTIHDLLSPGFLGAARFIVEGPLAITLVALLVAFTGREWSPFFFAFPLIVAGAALVVDAPITLLLAIGAGIGYLAAVFIRPPDDPLLATAVAAVALNLAALLLLAFVASVVARAQRRSRLEAIRLSTVDSLTGLFNRSYFFAALEREIQRSARTRPRLLPADDGSRRAEGGQRPVRPLPRRSGPADRGRDDPGPGPADRHGGPLRRRRVRRRASRDGAVGCLRAGREDPPRRRASGRSRWTGSTSERRCRSVSSSTRATAGPSTSS